MKVTININKKTAKHLESPHTFHDECGEACEVLYKVQKEIDKKKKTLGDKNFEINSTIWSATLICEIPPTLKRTLKVLIKICHGQFLGNC